MTDDLVQQLRDAVSHDMDEYDFRDDLMLDAAKEIERLRAWKAQATEILARWDAVADTIDTGPNQLGLHKYDIVYAQLQSLRASNDILERLRHQWTGEYDPTGRLLSEASEEIERLRRLINDWADAQDDLGGYRTGTDAAELAASRALRKAVGR